MGTVVVRQEEYEQLKRQAEAYKRLVARVFESITPGSVEEVVSDFRASGLYTDEFLSDLETGLAKSSLADRPHEDQTPSS